MEIKFIFSIILIFAFSCMPQKKPNNQFPINENNNKTKLDSFRNLYAHSIYQLESRKAFQKQFSKESIILLTDDESPIMRSFAFLSLSENKEFFNSPLFTKLVKDEGIMTMLGDHGSHNCLLYTSPSPRDATLSRMPSSA